MNSLERESVYETYQKIGEHFSNTRHYIWPNTRTFVDSIPKDSLVADIGCGNGRNMYRNDLKWKGMDFCDNFVESCKEKGQDVILGNILDIPFEDNTFDYTICIAVVHHLSTEERRRKAVQELVRITKPKGKILIQVWGFNEEKYDTQEAMVEWNLQKKYNNEKKNIKINRYYHLFIEDELDKLVPLDAAIIDRYSEYNNWVVVLEKL